MSQRLFVLLAAAALLFPSPAGAMNLVNLRGIVHDPQHRPIEGAQVTVRARNSDWSQTVQSDPDGQFALDAVPEGDYRVSVEA